MKKRKWIAALMVVVLLLQAFLPSGIFAASENGEHPLPEATSTSNRPFSEYVDTDLNQFVRDAISESITVLEAQHIWEHLTDVQKEKAGELLAIQSGIPIAEWHRFVKRHREHAMLAKSQRGHILGFPGEIWREPIENTWTSGYPPGTTFASSYWNSPMCDDDPSDPDWAFYFYQPYEWYSRNPDGLRWTSDSARVYLAFMAAYRGNLNGYSFSWNEAHLCIGTNGVKAAGGPDNVRNNLFLSPDH